MHFARFLYQQVGQGLLGAVPGQLLSWVMPPSKVASSVEIDVRQTSPISINLRSTTVPSVTVYFRLTNNASIKLVLDRMLVELRVEQPTTRGAVLRRYELTRGQTRDDIVFTQFLDGFQKGQIENHVENGRLAVPGAVQLTAYFESKVGMVTVDRRLELHDVVCT
jgi:hypothetical protein